MRNQHTPFAREGYPFIGGLALVTLVFGGLAGVGQGVVWPVLTGLGLVLTLFTAWFFRNPERVPPAGEKNVVAPADGKVIFVGEVREPRCGEAPVTKISIFMNVFNVHVNRVPVSGTVVDRFYNAGSFLNAALDKASTENEQGGLVVQTDNGQRVMFVQIAGLIARRIVTYPVVGDRLERGRRYGLIRFGSRVDVYLPPGTRIAVRLGQLTVAGETILGELP
ncbi:MAG: phosphatidylserine decarboxylase family protein [Deltaproteobacteria bacterium]|nr:MAG: phosphatidylserine decarboxylase family protein [Deltaproteobacteria bacterium]